MLHIQIDLKIKTFSDKSWRIGCPNVCQALSLKLQKQFMSHKHCNGLPYVHRLGSVLSHSSFSFYKSWRETDGTTAPRCALMLIVGRTVRSMFCQIERIDTTFGFVLPVWHKLHASECTLKVMQCKCPYIYLSSFVKYLHEIQ